MKIKRRFVYFGIIVLLLFAGCASVNRHYAIQTFDSGKVLFSNILLNNKYQTGIKVTGNVRQKTPSSRRVKIPGHIHVQLLSRQNRVLRTIRANTHRKYANSSVWHFDAVLKTNTIDANDLADARVVVKYHNRH